MLSIGYVPLKLNVKTYGYGRAGLRNFGARAEQNLGAPINFFSVDVISINYKFCVTFLGINFFFSKSRFLLEHSF